jgi:hypothetical protein
VQRVASIKATILLELKTIGKIALVFSRCVVALLTLSASQCYDISHFISPLAFAFRQFSARITQ